MSPSCENRFGFHGGRQRLEAGCALPPEFRVVTRASPGATCCLVSFLTVGGRRARRRSKPHAMAGGCGLARIRARIRAPRHERRGQAGRLTRGTLRLRLTDDPWNEARHRLLATLIRERHHASIPYRTLRRAHG